MRKKFIAGNWKMNTNAAQGVELAAALAKAIGSSTDVEVAVCPPALYLSAVGAAIKGSSIGLGAQNCHHEAKGAFTGEIAPAMLLDVGCKYVILGHSERRQLFHETNADVNKKTIAALAAGLTPIVCVGESLAERQANKTSDVVREQVQGSLAGLAGEQILKLVIAYEPIWAIGTGVVATPEQAEEVHADLRSLLTSRYTAAVADKVRIQYGGSVNAENAKTLLSQPNIDGALVGGASLKADGFLAIINGAK
ncbi:triose-phosphate isomerase [Anatilimnocola floriformis]|uniref:triose-phosphate isomerase n=1 Tax=Anatilimnocola floriformis TaxID=2948575 RepID=UPI0020C25180|nr:triose-phosphate isomerase [Anatilimnocola floriformis]